MDLETQGTELKNLHSQLSKQLTGQNKKQPAKEDTYQEVELKSAQLTEVMSQIDKAQQKLVRTQGMISEINKITQEIYDEKTKLAKGIDTHERKQAHKKKNTNLMTSEDLNDIHNTYFPADMTSVTYTE
jgi:hypothetical protein